MKILVIGEKCIDRFIYCETTKFCPEAPVPVLKPIEVVENDGMSGNVVKNIVAINSEALVTNWSQDEIIVKTRFVEKKSNHMFIRVDEGEYNVTPIELTNDRLKEISEFDIVIISDYDKGFLSNEDLTIIGKNSKLSIIDSKRILSEEVISNFSFVKLNEKESVQNSNLLNHKNIIVTLGSRGTSYLGKIFPSPNPQETIDVSGAGDTFTAAFIVKFKESNDIEESIIYANNLSSIVVSKRGVATP